MYFQMRVFKFTWSRQKMWERPLRPSFQLHALSATVSFKGGPLSEEEKLPETPAGLHEKIHEPVGPGSQVPDAVVGGE